MITTKQLTAVLAVTALLAVAVIGVGYAYTATTSNTGNSVTDAYLKVTLDDYDESVVKNFQQDTITAGSGTTGTIEYTIPGTQGTDYFVISGSSTASEDGVYAKIGQITVTVDDEKTDAKLAAHKLTAAMSRALAENEYLYVFVSTTGYECVKDTVKSLNGTTAVTLATQASEASVENQAYYLTFCVKATAAEDVDGTATGFQDSAPLPNVAAFDLTFVADSNAA